MLLTIVSETWYIVLLTFIIARTKKEWWLAIFRRVELALRNAYMLFHRHKWSEWEDDYFNDRTWNHQKRAWRHCQGCKETEMKLLSLKCTKYAKEGKYCEKCLPYAQEIEQTIDKEAIEAYIMDMKQKLLEKGSPSKPLIDRNKELYKYLVSGHSLAEAAREFNISRARAHQIFQAIEKKIEKVA